MSVIIDGGAGVTFPDTVQQTNAVTNTGGAPRYYAARAWITFDGSVSPPIVLASVNVASVVRDSTGVYTITFSTAMASATYSVVASATISASIVPFVSVDSAVAPTTSAFRIQVSGINVPAGSASSVLQNNPRISVVVFA